jgi:hypothetical protein
VTEQTVLRWPDDTPVHTAVGEAVGAASVCWEHVDQAGVFDSERASRIVDDLLTFLRRKTLGLTDTTEATVTEPDFTDLSDETLLAFIDWVRLNDPRFSRDPAVVRRVFTAYAVSDPGGPDDD